MGQCYLPLSFSLGYYQSARVCFVVVGFVLDEELLDGAVLVFEGDVDDSHLLVDDGAVVDVGGVSENSESYLALAEDIIFLHVVILFTMINQDFILYKKSSKSMSGAVS